MLTTKKKPASIKPTIKSGKNRVSLNWTQLEAVLTGVSAIDLPSLAIRTHQDAKNFALEYGFDVDDPLSMQEVVRVHREAVEFIDEYFLSPAQRALFSDEVRHPKSVLDLLVYSSNYLNKSNVRQKWACAVLKVMHGIFHIDHDSKLMYFDEIRKQIFESINRVIISEGDKHYLADSEMRVPLYFYEKKRNKDRKSILLKLLQKPSYVASDIYDHLGIRLIFDTKVECLMALKLLRRAHLITVTNIKPFRSRNNLVDLKTSKKVFNRYRPLLSREDDYPSDILNKIDDDMESAFVKRKRDNNPHSAIEFRSIQITARKMIRIINPVYHQMKDLINHLGDTVAVPEHMLAEMEASKDMSFYFDFEIQLLDRQSYLSTLYGPASHEAYKRRQRETARKRILGNELTRFLDLETAEEGLGDV